MEEIEIFEYRLREAIDSKDPFKVAVNGYEILKEGEDEFKEMSLINKTQEKLYERINTFFISITSILENEKWNKTDVLMVHKYLYEFLGDKYPVKIKWED